MKTLRHTQISLLANTPNQLYNKKNPRWNEVCQRARKPKEKKPKKKKGAPEDGAAPPKPKKERRKPSVLLIFLIFLLIVVGVAEAALLVYIALHMSF